MLTHLWNFSDFPVLWGREQIRTGHVGKEGASLSLEGGPGAQCSDLYSLRYPETYSLPVSPPSLCAQARHLSPRAHFQQGGHWLFFSSPTAETPFPLALSVSPLARPLDPTQHLRSVSPIREETHFCLVVGLLCHTPQR